MRLDKYVAGALGLTRSEARSLIGKGKITVNGAVCKKADTTVKEDSLVEKEGNALCREEFVYIMLNKPQGVVSAAEDKRDVTVVDLVKEDFPRRELFPAGRLDKTTTGFVLITDDGAFAHDILAPKRHVSKTYRVLLDTPVTQEMEKAFEEGVTLADGSKMKPAGLIPDETDPKRCTVILRQGVYHQIKRMFGALGAGVNGLHREAIGGLVLDEQLQQGQWRRITPEEKERIQADASAFSDENGKNQKSAR